MKGVLKDSAAVFEGQVLSVEIVAAHTWRLRPEVLVARGVYRFSIERSYKGPRSGEVVVQSGLGGADCSVHFEVGGRYLVVAFADSPPGFDLYTNVCAGTDYLYHAHAQLGYLRGEVQTVESWRQRQEELRAPRGANGSIAGRVTGFDAPNEHLQVQAWRLVQGQRELVCVTDTSADGAFLLPVPAGTYLLRALDWPGSELLGYYASSDLFARAVPVRVAPGEHRQGINFSVGIPATYTLTGSVRDSFWTVRPRGPLNVLLRDRDYRSHHQERRVDVRNDGSFQLSDVYPGRYHVETEFLFEDTDVQREWVAEVPVIDVPGSTSGVTITIRSRGGTMSNRLSDVCFSLARWSRTGAGLASLALVATALLVLSGWFVRARLAQQQHPRR